MKALFAIPVSKLIMSGVIASTFLTVSCQKRGVRPPNAGIAAAEKTTDQNLDLTNGPMQDGSPNLQQPEQPTDHTVDNTVIQDRQGKRTDPTEEKKAEDKKSETATVVITEADKKEESKTDVVIETKKEDKKSEDKKSETSTVVITEDKKADENKTDKQTEDKKETTADKKDNENQCTDYVLNKTSEMLKIYEEIKNTKEKDQLLQLTQSYVKACGEFGRSINNHKNKSCDLEVEAGKTIKLSEATFLESCLYFGYALLSNGIDNSYGKKYVDRIKNEIKTLKATTFKLSNESLALLKKDSNDFKLFTLNGEIKSDATILRDAKDVACSFTNTNLELVADSTTMMKVASIENDEANKVSVLKLSIESKDKDYVDVSGSGNEKVSAQNATLACKNLPADHFYMRSLLKSFGKLIQVAK